MVFEIITLFTAGLIFFILLRRLPVTASSRTHDFWQGIEPATTTAGSQAIATITTQDSVEELLSRADQAFEGKQFDTAEQYYLKIAALKPDLPKVYNRLGIIYLERKNYKDARDAFLTALKFDAQVAPRHYNLAMAYLGMGNKRKAEAALKQAMSLEPKNDRYGKALEKLKGK